MRFERSQVDDIVRLKNGGRAIVKASPEPAGSCKSCLIRDRSTGERCHNTACFDRERDDGREVYFAPVAAAAHRPDTINETPRL